MQHASQCWYPSVIQICSQGRAISVYIEQLYIDDLLDALPPVADDEIATLHQSVATLTIVAERLDVLRLGRTRRAPARGDDGSLV